MRFRHADGSVVHLAYCTNVHPADDLQGVIAQLQRFPGRVRSRLGAARLGVGLWLSARAARDLMRDPAAVGRLRETLHQEGLEVVTLNGFPYGDFHAEVVKQDVYHPDWTDPLRLSYTQDLAQILVQLLPDDAVEGSISTLPLAWRDGWDAGAAEACRGQLEQLERFLAELEADTGRRVRVGIEPEPGCIVETIAQAADVLDGLSGDHLGLCLDTCHAAVQFEDPSVAVDRDVAIVKTQLACALEVRDPQSTAGREALADFVEPRFLHQTRTLTAGAVSGVNDLPEAMAGALAASAPWRVHFHTAIDAAGDDEVAPTRDVLDRALDVLVGGAVAQTTHLEVETYTWSVLPPAQRPADDEMLIAGLAREMTWARVALTARGLTEEQS